jgi:hypothetical protein
MTDVGTLKEQVGDFEVAVTALRGRIPGPVVISLRHARARTSKRRPYALFETPADGGFLAVVHGKVSYADHLAGVSMFNTIGVIRWSMRVSRALSASNGPASGSQGASRGRRQSECRLDPMACLSPWSYARWPMAT